MNTDCAVFDRFTGSLVHGSVMGTWVPSGAGKPFMAFRQHNALSYAASEALAAAYGGDASMVPGRMGFLYGTKASPELPPISRTMTMASLQSLAESCDKGNVQVVRFSRSPSLAESTAGRRNVVEFHGVTRDDLEGKYQYDTSGGPFCGKLADGMYVYRAVLLDGAGDAPSTVLAMVDLSRNGTYRAKPAGYELALDWRVTFE